MHCCMGLREARWPHTHQHSYTQRMPRSLQAPHTKPMQLRAAATAGADRAAVPISSLLQLDEGRLQSSYYVFYVCMSGEKPKTTAGSWLQLTNSSSRVTK